MTKSKFLDLLYFNAKHENTQAVTKLLVQIMVRKFKKFDPNS